MYSGEVFRAIIGEPYTSDKLIYLMKFIRYSKP